MSGFQINETPLKHKNDESDQSPLTTKVKKFKATSRGTLSLERGRKDGVPAEPGPSKSKQ